MVSMRVNRNLTLHGIFLLIKYTFQKAIQQVHAIGPLVSHMDSRANLPQYMRDKDAPFSTIMGCRLFQWNFTVHTICLS